MKYFKYLVLFFAFAFKPYSQEEDNTNISTWKNTLQQGSGELTVYWHKSVPFIFKNDTGLITGIEHDVLVGFKNYIQKYYGVDLHLNWVEKSSTQEIIAVARDLKKEGTIGISSISSSYPGFTGLAPIQPHMPNISIIIASNDVPIVKNTSEFDSIFNNLKAITIERTPHEYLLKEIKDLRKLKFDLKFIPGNIGVIQTVGTSRQSFAIIYLYEYLQALKHGPKLDVNRQFIFPQRSGGYTIVCPEKSDWQTPLNEYLNSIDFDKNMDKIISTYLEKNIYTLVQKTYAQADNNIILLSNAPPERQSDGIYKKNKIKRYVSAINILFVAIIGLLLAFAYIILNLNRSKSKAVKQQIQQKIELENQRKAIEHQSTEMDKQKHDIEELKNEQIGLLNTITEELLPWAIEMRSNCQNIGQNIDKPTIQESFKKIQTATSHINHIVGKIADYYTLDKISINQSIERIDAVEFTYQIIKKFSKISENKGIKIEFIYQYDQCFFICDKTLLVLILENLISNAIKFSERNKKIVVTLIENKDALQFSIKDQGPGIVGQEEEILFNKYTKLSTTPTNGEPSIGLGLSTVKKCVLMLKGKVWFEPSISHGSTFIVELPKHPLINS